MAGSHRAQRGGGRAAAREARREKARKRNQTIAAGVAVVVLVGGGGIAALNAFGGDDSPNDQKTGKGADDKPGDSKVLADDKGLLDAAGAKTFGGSGTWSVGSTTDGSGAGENDYVCQAQRFADPSGQRTWVRKFANPTTKDSAVQWIEVSSDPAAAEKAYDMVVGWFSQCASAKRTRLNNSYQLSGMGDKGWIAVYGQATGPKTRYRTVSVTLAGLATLVVEHDVNGTAPPKPDAVLNTTAAALQKICPQTGGCGTGTPTAKAVLLPTSEPAGFMAPAELPIIAAIDKPWVSTPSKSGNTTQCIQTDPKKAKATKYATQTYLAPGAKVPTEFGLDDTVARFASANAAAAYVSSVRKNVDGCQKRVVTAKVSSSGNLASGGVTGEAWEVSLETGKGNKAKFRMGVAAAGNHAVFLLFPVLPDLDITDSAFLDTLRRAAERSESYK
ncbi:hypothetical protein E1263_15135 [Kribbella antibiotica]|uniref:Sensor domain-containing protein n=1 Tax=Kribbella antibiotica TaxID=190195 RepID=A0A4R4ZLE9_9ACTN|nr:hypothetical protein [Kribbella antibiotica]TDD59375.1 hypothetical protein E1263_15135 [Kribbella antibiotica]